MESEKGFTLIELLVVIAIVGLLSGIVVTSMNNSRVKSRDSRRKQDIKAFQTAIEMYNTLNGRYPGNATAILIDSTIIPTTIMTRVPQDPQYIAGTGAGQSGAASGAARGYWYVSDATGSSYCVGALLETATSGAVLGCSGTHSTSIVDKLDNMTGYSATLEFKMGQ